MMKNKEDMEPDSPVDDVGPGVISAPRIYAVPATAVIEHVKDLLEDQTGTKIITTLDDASVIGCLSYEDDELKNVGYNIMEVEGFRESKQVGTDKVATAEEDKRVDVCVLIQVFVEAVKDRLKTAKEKRQRDNVKNISCTISKKRKAKAFTFTTCAKRDFRCMIQEDQDIFGLPSDFNDNDDILVWGTYVGKSDDGSDIEDARTEEEYKEGAWSLLEQVDDENKPSIGEGFFVDDGAFVASEPRQHF